MRKIWKAVILYLILVAALSGCGRQTAPPRLVTRVDVTLRRNGKLLQRQYTTPEKMESVLYYLRSLKKTGNVEDDPLTKLGDAFQIVVQLSDGQQRVYYQVENRYLSTDRRNWIAIDPEQAQKLYPLLDIMPGDRDAIPASQISIYRSVISMHRPLPPSLREVALPSGKDGGSVLS